MLSWRYHLLNDKTTKLGFFFFLNTHTSTGAGSVDLRVARLDKISIPDTEAEVPSYCLAVALKVFF